MLEIKNKDCFYKGIVFIFYLFWLNNLICVNVGNGDGLFVWINFVSIIYFAVCFVKVKFWCCLVLIVLKILCVLLENFKVICC